MDIRNEIEVRRESIIRDNGGEWTYAFEALLLRVEELESRLCACNKNDSLTEEPKEEVPNGLSITQKSGEVPNGLFCASCNKKLYGQKRRFCSKQCANSYYYIHHIHPDATPVEIKTLVVGSGWQDDSQKRRRYKKIDLEKAAISRARAVSAMVPA